MTVVPEYTLRIVWQNPELYGPLARDIDLMVPNCVELLRMAEDRFARSDIHIIVYRDPRCRDFLRVLPTFTDFNAFHRDRSEAVVAILTATLDDRTPLAAAGATARPGDLRRDLYIAMPVFPQTQIDWSGPPARGVRRALNLAGDTLSAIGALLNPAGPKPFDLASITKLTNSQFEAQDISASSGGRGAPDGQPTVLIAAHWLDVGGAENLVVDNIRFCRKAGYRVHVIADKVGPYRLLDQIRGSIDRLFLLPNMLEHRSFANIAHRLFKRYAYDVLHLHHCQYMYTVLPSIRLLYPHTKIFDSTHIIEHGNGGFAAMSATYSAFIDVHHVISAQLRDAQHRQAGLAPDKLRLGYMTSGRSQPAHSRAPGRDHSSTGDLTPFRKAKIGLAVNVLFVGRMVGQKRPELFISFAKRLVGRTGDTTFSFTMVGDGPLEARCRRLARRLGLVEHIEFLAHDADVPRLMEDADFVVSTSINEGLPLIFFEAAEQNALCIATDVGSNDEIVGRGQLFEVHARKLPAAMARRVAHLVQSENTYAHELDAQATRYEEILSQPNSDDIFAELYRPAQLDARVSESVSQ